MTESFLKRIKRISPKELFFQYVKYPAMCLAVGVLAACAPTPTPPTFVSSSGVAPDTLKPPAALVTPGVIQNNEAIINIDPKDYILLAGMTMLQEYGEQVVADQIIIYKKELGDGWKLLVKGNTVTGLNKYVYVDDSVKGKPMFYKFYDQMTLEELQKAKTSRRTIMPADPAKYIRTEYDGLSASVRSFYGKSVKLEDHVNLVRVVRPNGAIIDGVVCSDLGIGVAQLLKDGKLTPEQIPAIAAEAVRKVRLIAQETGIITNDLNPKNVRIKTDDFGVMRVNIIDFEKSYRPENIRDPKAYVTGLKRLYTGIFSQAAANRRMPLDKFLQEFVAATKPGKDRAFAIQLAQSLWEEMPKYSQGNPLTLPENRGGLRLEITRDTVISGARTVGKLGVGALLVWGLYETYNDLAQAKEFLPADTYIGYGTTLRYPNRELPYDVLAENDIALVYPWGRRMDFAQIPAFGKDKGISRSIVGVVPFINDKGLLPTSLELVYQGDSGGAHRVINTLTGEDITDILVPGAQIPVLVTSVSTEPAEDGSKSTVKFINVYRMFATVSADGKGNSTGNIVIQHGKIGNAYVPELVSRMPFEVNVK